MTLSGQITAHEAQPVQASGFAIRATGRKTDTGIDQTSAA